MCAHSSYPSAAAGWAFCFNAPGHRAEAGQIDSEPTDPIRVRLRAVDSAPSHAGFDTTVTVEVCPAAPRTLDEVLRPPLQ